jgi:hypothetical protein
VRLPRRSGLHGRLIAAFVAVSALSLAVAIVPLLTALDRPLREDALTSLEQTGLRRGSSSSPLRRMSRSPGWRGFSCFGSFRSGGAKFA